MSLDWRAFINIWWRHKQTFEYMRIWGVTHLYGVILSLMLNSSFAPLRSLMVLIVYIIGRSHSSISLDDKVYLSQLIDARMCGGKIIWLKSSIHTFTHSGVLTVWCASNRCCKLHWCRYIDAIQQSYHLFVWLLGSPCWVRSFSLCKCDCSKPMSYATIKTNLHTTMPYIGSISRCRLCPSILKHNRISFVSKSSQSVATNPTHQIIIWYGSTVVPNKQDNICSVPSDI